MKSIALAYRRSPLVFLLIASMCGTTLFSATLKTRNGQSVNGTVTGLIVLKGAVRKCKPGGFFGPSMPQPGKKTEQFYSSLYFGIGGFQIDGIDENGITVTGPPISVIEVLTKTKTSDDRALLWQVLQSLASDSAPILSAETRDSLLGTGFAKWTQEGKVLLTPRSRPGATAMLLDNGGQANFLSMPVGDLPSNAVLLGEFRVIDSQGSLSPFLELTADGQTSKVPIADLINKNIKPKVP